jgi:hypothetical protein
MFLYIQQFSSRKLIPSFNATLFERRRRRSSEIFTLFDSARCAHRKRREDQQNLIQRLKPFSTGFTPGLDSPNLRLGPPFYFGLLKQEVAFTGSLFSRTFCCGHLLH